MPRNGLARLNTDGTLDTGFNSNVGVQTYGIYSIAVQADGKILVSGDLFNGIARLDPTTGLVDSSFNANATDDVFAIAVQADGKILVGGIFTAIGGQTRNRIARLDPVTGLADSFNPNASGEVLTITLQTDGRFS